MKTIKPSNSEKLIMVDNEDFEVLNRHKWRLDRYSYACRNVARSGKSRTGKRKFGAVYVHLEILPRREGFVTDHINRNRLDNRRINLRYATVSQNQTNKGSTNRYGYRGVYKKSDEKTYTMKICKDGKRINESRFKTVEEAARRYDVIARELHGDFAILNFPDKC